MTFRNRIVWPLIVSALAVPALAQADSFWHPSPGDAGFTSHPDHVESTKTRAEVTAEVEAARKDGTLELLQRGAPLPVNNASPGKSREQVIEEMRSESPEERRERTELMTGG